MASESDFTVEHREGLPFTAVSVDLSEYAVINNQLNSVNATGYKADGTTVSQQFKLDRVIDGTGPVERRTLPGAFGAPGLCAGCGSTLRGL